MNRRQKIIVSVTGIFIVLLALVGVTFAYFLTRIQGNTNPTSISVTTADLKLVYGDGSGVVTGTNIEPGWTNDGASGRPAPKTFTVTNEGNETVENFNIYMEEVINSLSRKEDLIYTITCVNTTTGATSTECEDFDIVENEVTEEDELIFPSVMSVIATDTLEEGETHTYTLKVTYKNLNDVDQSEDMGKRFNAKINIYDAKTKFLASEIMNNSKSTSTVDYNKTTYVAPDLLGTLENTSTPVIDVNLENEKVLSYAFDDFGTSYYYRGTVEDNYVNFAGMCWRIVRIQGDGSIKLILEDQDQLCDSKDSSNNYNMDGNWNIGEGNFGYSVYGPGELTASDNVTANDGDLWILDYLNGNTDYENSMATAFQEFQSELSNTINTKYGKNINQTLQGGNWCLGDAGYDEFSRELISDDEKLDRIVTGGDIYYDSSFKYWDALGYEGPYDFKCNGTSMGLFGDETTPMYVGGLTISELAHAGLVIDDASLFNYLTNQYQNDNELIFLPISYIAFWGYADNIAYVAKNGYISFAEYIGTASEYFSFRPSITLSKDTKIISGNGTNKKPYVIG